jgi:hypothetical protein
MLDSLLETQIQECLAGKDAKVGRCLFQMQALNRYYDFKPYLDYHQARFRERVLKDWDMDIAVIVTRLQKLDSYLQSLRHWMILNSLRRKS